ncbi:MAG: citrate/2-methylcitrate synthase [Clostridia bacterium]|nr:citrate/2-methylcitrate synthase [Clostridia bacterium]
MNRIDPHFSEVIPEIEALAKLCVENGHIDPELYAKYDVKRGLRDVSGRGVLTGLTEIAEVHSYSIVDEELVPCEGKLFYRGIDIEQIVDGFINDGRCGFEETVYLLLFGNLPTKDELGNFTELLSSYRSLPKNFLRDVIMKASSRDLMNSLAKSILTLYSYDGNADDTSIGNILRQSLELIAIFPMLVVYGYQTYSYYHDGKSLIIHSPDKQLSTAENLLLLLRGEGNYTELEVKMLDLALVLHADHGGGNNSTFTTRVVTSTGTDTYSAITAAVGALKGPRHGGANIKVVQMFDDMKKNVSDWTDDEQIGEYLKKLLHKEAFDKKGLIYGMGHAVYSLSDPRSNLFKRFVKELATEKGRLDELELYSRVERLAPEVIASERRMYKGISANIDFYSGFVYSMLDLPRELYTPIFAVSRIAGWCSHRIEELVNTSKIIRPAYKNVSKHRPYTPIDKR